MDIAVSSLPVIDSGHGDVIPLRVLGSLKVLEGAIEREHFECAAWFRDHKLDPGEYPICEFKSRYGGSYHGAYVPSVVVDAFLGSLFGGVHYGPDRSGPREIGRRGVKFIRYGDSVSGERVIGGAA